MTQSATLRWNAGRDVRSMNITKLGRRLLMFLAALVATHVLGFTPDFDSLLEPVSQAFLLILPGLRRLMR